MISTKRAAKIVFESDDVKRNELIDKLTEDDAKLILKCCLAAMASGTKLNCTLG